MYAWYKIIVRHYFQLIQCSKESRWKISIHSFLASSILPLLSVTLTCTYSFTLSWPSSAHRTLNFTHTLFFLSIITKPPRYISFHSFLLFRPTSMSEGRTLRRSKIWTSWSTTLKASYWRQRLTRLSSTPSPETAGWGKNSFKGDRSVISLGIANSSCIKLLSNYTN